MELEGRGEGMKEWGLVGGDWREGGEGMKESGWVAGVGRKGEKG